MVVIILGVSGAGKTILGKLLARELGWAFYEADDFHSPVNVEKMHAGIPLTDEDKWQSLESLRELVKRCLAAEFPTRSSRVGGDQLRRVVVSNLLL